MKSAYDPRHIRRIKIIENLFAGSFLSQKDFFISEEKNPLSKKEIIRVRNTLEGIRVKTGEINSLIEKAAPQFPVEKIAKIDVAILKLAIFELVYEKKEPPKVIIDEAVELAKNFGGEGSPAFVNGVLGYLLKNKNAKISRAK